MTDSVVHIAGPDIQVGAQLRQRCAWCGAVLFDYALDRIAVPEGEDPRPGTWPVGELVEVDGPAGWVRAHVDGEPLPPNACAQIDHDVTGTPRETGDSETETGAWPCSWRGCPNPAAYAITFHRQEGHVHDCVQHTAELREWTDVESVTPLPCKHPHGDGTTWVDTPRPLGEQTGSSDD